MKAHSERVPGKNMRPLCGQPLFHWIMDALNESGVIDEIIINTDSEEIANNAKSNFNVTIHMRPEYLLTIQADEANQIIAYDLEHTKGDYFIQTHSTNPLVKPKTIKDAVDIFFGKISENDSLFSVTSLQGRFYNQDGKALNHNPANLIKTQELPTTYEENSCFYIFTRNSFFSNHNRIGKRPYLYPINRFEAVDIDDEFDFFMAETLMDKKLENIKDQF